MTKLLFANALHYGFTTAKCSFRVEEKKAHNRVYKVRTFSFPTFIEITIETSSVSVKELVSTAQVQTCTTSVKQIQRKTNKPSISQYGESVIDLFFGIGTKSTPRRNQGQQIVVTNRNEFLWYFVDIKDRMF